MVAFASLLATDGTVIHLFAPSPACVLCNFGIRERLALSLLPKIEVLPAEIAADLAELAAKMRSRNFLRYGLADLAADQSFLREVPRSGSRCERLSAKSCDQAQLPSTPQVKQAASAARLKQGFNSPNEPLFQP